VDPLKRILQRKYKTLRKRIKVILLVALIRYSRGLRIKIRSKRMKKNQKCPNKKLMMISILLLATTI
jgi:hypothetical protein